MKAIGRVDDDVFGVDLPDETGNFLFDLPLSVDKKDDNDKGDENGS